MKKIYYRALQPTPPFFIRLRNASLLVALISLLVIITPFNPPWMVVTAGYLLEAGLVSSAVCQLTVDTDAAFLRWIHGGSTEYLPRFIDKTLLK